LFPRGSVAHMWHCCMGWMHGACPHPLSLKLYWILVVFNCSFHCFVVRPLRLRSFASSVVQEDSSRDPRVIVLLLVSAVSLPFIIFRSCFVFVNRSHRHHLSYPCCLSPILQNPCCDCLIPHGLHRRPSTISSDDCSWSTCGLSCQEEA
jgi:hypothetical protein